MSRRRDNDPVWKDIKTALESGIMNASEAAKRFGKKRTAIIMRGQRDGWSIPGKKITPEAAKKLASKEARKNTKQSVEIIVPVKGDEVDVDTLDAQQKAKVQVVWKRIDDAWEVLGLRDEEGVPIVTPREFIIGTCELSKATLQLVGAQRQMYADEFMAKTQAALVDLQDEKKKALHHMIVKKLELRNDS